MALSSTTGQRTDPQPFVLSTVGRSKGTTGVSEEGRHAPLPGDNYRMLTLAIGHKKQDRKARSQELLKIRQPGWIKKFRRCDLEKDKKQVICHKVKE